MALQTSSAPSEPAQQTQNSSSGSSDGFLSPKASPPLILAFLAIGFFSIAMIVTFSWRRMREGDPLTSMGRPRPRDDLVEDIGERPVLWNLWADEQNGKVASSWDRIMPLSATTIPPTVIPDNAYTTDTQTPFHNYIPHSRKTFHPKRNTFMKIPDDAGGRSAPLQIAVAIILPSEKYEEDSLDYCIGVKEVLWKEEPGTSLL